MSFGEKIFYCDKEVGFFITLLGRGAFGEVWLAERATSLLTTQVALKLPLNASADLEAIRQEAQLWLKASGHPNVVPVLEAAVFDGQVVIASEYIAGGSLHKWLQVQGGKAPSDEEAVSMVTGILAGLDYLHRAGLTHRDLKPENVLLQDGIPRLTDFGLARVLKTEGITGNISGTPRYMAPETFSGSYSAASDLWAVGIMLHELLAESHPFPTGDLMALISAIQTQDPATLPDTIPERLRCIVTRLLAKGPAERYATASAVREALRTALQPGPAPEETVSALTPNNLPQQPTSFIGREREIAELRGLLTSTRLLTLTGCGGCGKTRLALQVAAHTGLTTEVMEEYPDGVWLVELAPLTDPGLVPQTVAGVFGLKEEPGKPILQTLTDHVKGKRLLLLLDNCEHLLTACAQLADAILRHCPLVAILATSREALGIGGETTYRVPSLSLPDPKSDTTPDSIGGFESVRLFVERAMQAKTYFTLTSQNASTLASICHRLDGIPLAIELAAARVRSLTVEDINGKLDQRFRLLTGGSRTALPRQQTLRSLIDWSYDLLNEAEKALLCRLSVFSGGWTLDAAEQVCTSEPVEEWEMLDLLTSLSDKSLVAAETSGSSVRYRLLETVRQYSRDRLLESGEAETWRSRHLNFFLALAEEAEPYLTGPDQQPWLERLETEHDNLRAALERSGTDRGSAEPGLRLGGVLWRIWYVRGHLSEGRERLTRALELGRSCSAEARAKALNGAGVLAYCEGDYPAARALHEESLGIKRELGNRWGIAASLTNLGNVSLEQGAYPAARALQEESLAILQTLGDRLGIAHSLGAIASLAAAEGVPLLASRLWGAAERSREEIGAPLPPNERPRHEGRISDARTALGDDAAFDAAWRDCRAMTMEQAIELALKESPRDPGRRLEAQCRILRLVLQGQTAKGATAALGPKKMTIQCCVGNVHQILRTDIRLQARRRRIKLGLFARVFEEP